MPRTTIGGPKLKVPMAVAVFAKTSDGDDEVEKDSVETEPLAVSADQEDADSGGTRVLDGDEGINGASDREHFHSLPLLHHLPKSARLPVYFSIDETFEVHSRSSTAVQPAEMRRAITLAIAQHLREKKVELRSPGDWRNIPCIGTDAQLRKLAKKQMRGDTVSTAADRNISILDGLNHYGAEYKAFAIALANGDVITPQALITPAKRHKEKSSKMTRAAALRFSADAAAAKSPLPSDFLGEPWPKKTWVAFEKAQRQAGRNAKKALK